MRSAVFALALLVTVASADETADSPTPADDAAALHWVAREIEFVPLLDSLRRDAVRGTVLLRNVAVVDVDAARSEPHRSVRVEDGRIAWIGGVDDAPPSTGETVIDGSGLWLAPGLVDMHAHTESIGEQLLRIAAGVTTVREMDGFPWMLRLRETVRADALLAPQAFIAGTIIADRPFGDYTVVVHTEEEARRLVDAQVTQGYDFIKVHNRLAEPLFDAVADQARLRNRDLVGHVPHGITIDHAVHSGRMRTLEHLKGFIDDGTLMVSDEDYAAALAGAEVWLTPTFAVGLSSQLVGEEARRELARPWMRYVSSTRLADWREFADMQPDWRDRLLESLPAFARELAPLSMRERLPAAYPQAMQRLLPLHPRWLAGTDAAGYDFQVAGFALIDELHAMEQLGIAHAEVLRAATSEPARAMRRDGEFGRIEPGQRADLVLLAADPSADLSAFDTNRGVMAGGAWLDRAVLDAALERFARIQAVRDREFPLTAESLRAVASGVARLHARGIVLDPMRLAPAIAALQRLGFAAEASELDAAMVREPARH